MIFLRTIIARLPVRSQVSDLIHYLWTQVYHLGSLPAFIVVCMSNKFSILGHPDRQLEHCWSEHHHPPATSRIRASLPPELFQCCLEYAWTRHELTSYERVSLYHSVTRVSWAAATAINQLMWKRVHCTDWAEFEMYLRRSLALQTAWEHDDACSHAWPSISTIQAHPMFLLALSQLQVMRMSNSSWHASNIVDALITRLLAAGLNLHAPLFPDAKTLYLSADGGHEWMRQAPSLRRVHLLSFPNSSMSLLGIPSCAVQVAIGARSIQHLVLDYAGQSGQWKPQCGTQLQMLGLPMAFPCLETLEIPDGHLLQLAMTLPVTKVIVDMSQQSRHEVDIRPWRIPELLESGLLKTRSGEIVLKMGMLNCKANGWEEAVVAGAKHGVCIRCEMSVS